jgi:predicted  nucleic acid-binding Zn-ribbon protein
MDDGQWLELIQRRTDELRQEKLKSEYRARIQDDIKNRRLEAMRVEASQLIQNNKNAELARIEADVSKCESSLADTLTRLSQITNECQDLERKPAMSPGDLQSQLDGDTELTSLLATIRTVRDGIQALKGGISRESTTIEKSTAELEGLRLDAQRLVDTIREREYAQSETMTRVRQVAVLLVQHIALLGAFLNALPGERCIDNVDTVSENPPEHYKRTVSQLKTKLPEYQRLPPSGPPDTS